MHRRMLSEPRATSGSEGQVFGFESPALPSLNALNRKPYDNQEPDSVASAWLTMQWGIMVLTYVCKLVCIHICM